MNTTQTVSGVILSETVKAFRLNIEGVSDTVWLPKSQCRDVQLSTEDFNDGMPPARYITAVIPAWLNARLPRNSGAIPFATKPW